MSEVVRTGLELAPYAGAAAGFTIGALDGALAHRREVRNAKAFIEEEGPDLLDDRDTSTRFFRSPVVGAMAVTFAGFGLANGLAWYEKKPEDSGETSALHFIVDRSGATAFDSGGPTPAERIEKVIAQFDEQKGFKITAQVAEGGRRPATVRAPSEIASIPPFGDARLGDAFDVTTDSIRLSSRAADQTEGKTAITVFTSGKSFGKPETVVERANQLHTSIYVVNAEAEISEETEENFKAIAQKTGGTYWDLTEQENPQIAEQIFNQTKPEAKPQPEDHNWPFKALAAGLTALGIGLMHRVSRKLPLKYH